MSKSLKGISTVFIEYEFSSLLRITVYSNYGKPVFHGVVSKMVSVVSQSIYCIYCVLYCT